VADPNGRHRIRAVGGLAAHAAERSTVNVLAEFAVGQVFWSMVWFTLFFIWIWLLITVFADIFRSPDMGGGAKALWTIFVIVLPYLGVFVYLIARGHKMQEHSRAEAEAQEFATREYIHNVAGTGRSAADEIERLADLKAKGVITEAEFQAAKAKALG
jgi:ABC-type multidrug transport system fused ATPase/permease subunit